MSKLNNYDRYFKILNLALYGLDNARLNGYLSHRVSAAVLVNFAFSALFPDVVPSVL